MVIFLHGDNQLESRNQLNSLINDAKNKDKEIIRLDGEKINLNDVIQALEASSLFGLEKLVITENLFSRRQSKQKKDIIDFGSIGNNNYFKIKDVVDNFLYPSKSI